jgi:hypothetical protein
MEQETNTTHAIKWGVIIGLVYSVLLWLRYMSGGSSPIMMGVWALFGYIVILVLMLVSGFQLRKKNGGYIEFREIFKCLFISVLIFEAFYTAFNFIYLKYIDPEFFNKLIESTENMMLKANSKQADIDKTIDRMREQADANASIGSILKTYLFSIAFSGTFALILSAIIKKKKDPFLVENESFLKA